MSLSEEDWTILNDIWLLFCVLYGVECGKQDRKNIFRGKSFSGQNGKIYYDFYCSWGCQVGWHCERNSFESAVKIWVFYFSHEFSFLWQMDFVWRLEDWETGETN